MNRILNIGIVARLSLLAAVPLLAVSCFDTDVFEKSDRNRPTAIYVVNPFNTSTSIQGNLLWGEGTDDDPDIATVSLPAGSDLKNITINSIMIPSLATVVPDYKTVHDFETTRTFWIVAENGKDKRRLDVMVSIGEFTRQLKYSSLTDYWFPLGQFSDGNSYYGVGEAGQFSPWSNTNIVAAILRKASCVPSQFPNPAGHTVLTTLYNQAAGNTVGSGVASGSLFLGEFRSNSAFFLDRDKQQYNVDQGTPFIYKPVSVRFEYKYTPGTQSEIWVKGSSGKWESRQVAGKDSMEMCAILQKRTYDSRNPVNSRFERIGSAGYISCETVTEWKSVVVKFFYGQSEITGSTSTEPASYRVSGINKEWAPVWVYQFTTNASTGMAEPPVYDGSNTWKYNAQPISESWGNASDTPTHLSLIFNSSANGWRYEGAGADINRDYSGSKLELRNIELIYE